MHEINPINLPRVSDQIPSEKVLDLKNLSRDELLRIWDAWLRRASITDEQDAYLYSHGVFTEEPLE